MNGTLNMQKSVLIDQIT